MPCRSPPRVCDFLYSSGQKALNNGSLIPPLPGDSVEDQIISSHTCETSASNVVSASSTSTREITDHVSYRSHRQFSAQTYLETTKSLVRCLGMGSPPVHRHSGMMPEPSSKLECLRPCRAYTLLQDNCYINLMLIYAGTCLGWILLTPTLLGRRRSIR